jgi:hypothetical protein
MHLGQPTSARRALSFSRPLRYSLRACFAFVTALSLFFGWYFNRDRAFEKQQQICADLIASLGGKQVLWLGPEHPRECGTYDRPECLEFVVEKLDTWRSIFYRDGLREITGIQITDPTYHHSFTHAMWREATWREIVKLTSVRKINLECSIVDVEGIAQLRELPNLTSLGLECVVLSDECLRSIGQLRTLEELEITQTRTTFFRYDEPATDAGFAHLERLTRLRRLTLHGIQISDAAIAALRQKTPNCVVVK